MRAIVMLSALLIVVSVQPAVSQQSQPNVMIIAQALDRCMATYAVRLTRTTELNEEIYNQAAKGCASLNTEFIEGIKASVPPQQAAELLKAAEAAREPNFINMLAKIRADRAKRESAPLKE